MGRGASHRERGKTSTSVLDERSCPVGSERRLAAV